MDRSLQSSPAQEVDRMPPARAVAVVGAGAAGLVAARELLREGHAVTVFERSDRVGGTWAYDPRADETDPLGAAVHGSLYASLRTNLPRELMGFSGHESLVGRVFAGDPRTFPGHQEVLAFLRAFAEESGVARRVRLRAEVVRAAPPLGRGGESGERWSVAWRGEDGEVAVEAFDAVVVCNGHCTVPLVPKLPGIGKWRGKQMHSHNYRIPEPFRDQIVVVVGLGASGIDIAREISQVTKEVHIASRQNEHRLGKISIDPYLNVWMHAEVDCIQEDGQVRFAEGAAVAADVVLYCTGYRYHFPFLDLDELTVDDENRVGPLYKHVFPPKYAPNLSFVGLPVKTILFQSFELEAKWVARVLSGRAALPSEEGMLDAVREHYRRMEESGRPRRHTHALMPEWVEYMDWLAEQVGERRLEARRRDIYERALQRVWSLDGGYRDSCEDEEKGSGDSKV
ncbi:flavin-containing monooxygenase FMO GS-OX-like 2 [Triticum urartu]|nr:flavin-containing monooxygenase FMO GS-OX-like 2 [Triticum urartu]